MTNDVPGIPTHQPRPHGAHKPHQAPSTPPPADDPLDVTDAADPDDPKGRAIVLRQSDFVKLLNGDLDPEDLLPPTGPVADAYAELGKAGCTVSDGQIRNSKQCFDHHREALVVSEEKPNVVYSFKDTAEIDAFRAIQAGSAPPETRALHDGLTAVEGRGAKLVIDRGGHLLPTDAAGATVLLQRGETVTMLDRYGDPVQLATPEAVAAQARAAPAADATRDEIVTAMQTLEKHDIHVGPDFEIPEDIEVTDFKKMIKHQFAERRDPNHQPINQRKYTIDQLAGGGLATVSPKEDDSANSLAALTGAAPPEPEPMELADRKVLNKAQIQELAHVVGGSLTPVQKTYFDDMKAIRETRKMQVFTRESTGMDTGALHKANDLAAYLNLINGGEIVLLGEDGSLEHLDNPTEVHQFAATGQVQRTRPAPVDPAAPKTNLLAMYYDAPFDPTQKGGIYEDTPLRAARVGSDADVDMVTLRSDLPHKKNLRNEYLEPDQAKLLGTLDPKTMMNDPKTLERFVYDSLKAHPDDKFVRLMVAGHGGAELGLLPDGDENDATAHGAMGVDDFANAVHEGLARFNQETGRNRKIDNLMVGSCLMANTSFIHALAKKGDIKVLSASPETLMGNDPTVIFSYLADPKTAGRTAEEFASDMVDLLEGATAFPGGKKNLQFADTYGAYDLDPAKGKAMADSLDALFKAVVAEPQFAKYVKEDVAACPTYGVNRILNFQFGINQRDAIQVAERIAGDHRISSDAIKAACKAVVAATDGVVLKQKMNDRYNTRRGPTLYLPTEPFAIDDRLMQTDLLKNSAFGDFIKLVAEQPANRTLVESLSYEVDKVMSAMRKADKAKKKPTPAPSGGRPASGSGKTTASAAKKISILGGGPADEADENAEQLQGLEKVYRPWYAKAWRYGIGMPVVVAATAVGAVAGAAVGVALMGPLGTLLGLHAGVTGRSVAQNFLADKPDPAAAAAPASPSGSTPAAPGGSPASPPDPDADLGGMLHRAARPLIRVGVQAALFPEEIGGELVNRKLAYAHGNLVGRLGGGVAGTVGGAVGGVVAGAVVGGAIGGFVARGISRFITRT